MQFLLSQDVLTCSSNHLSLLVGVLDFFACGLSWPLVSITRGVGVSEDGSPDGPDLKCFDSYLVVPPIAPIHVHNWLFSSQVSMHLSRLDTLAHYLHPRYIPNNSYEVSLWPSSFLYKLLAGLLALDSGSSLTAYRT